MSPPDSRPGESLLLRTGWSRHVDNPQHYRDNFPRIADDLARWCVEKQVNILGVEPPSVADVNNKEELTRIHKILLGANITIVEGLTNLGALTQEKVFFVAAPLKIEGGDGCPCRAFAIEGGFPTTICLEMIPQHALVFGTTFLLAALAGAPAASLNDMDHGPFVSWTIRGEGGSVIYKGIAIKMGVDEPAAVCFDTDLLRFAVGWTGGFLRWYPERDGLERNPTIDGRVHFRNPAGPGWTATDSFADPRGQPYGPLPETAGRYRGLFLHGTNVVLSYSVGECEILELPGFIRLGTEAFFTRTLNLGKTAAHLTTRLLACDGRESRLHGVKAGATRGTLRLTSESENRLVAFDGLPAGAQWQIREGTLCLSLPPLTEAQRLRLMIGEEPRRNLTEMETRLRAYLSQLEAVPDLAELGRGGPARWGEPLKTKAVASRTEAVLAVDTLTVPKINPWKSWLRFGGLDFLSADRALLASVSGDVWLVSGLQDAAGDLSWKRFATGLYQPLGLKVVEGQVYVLGRDQITRLHDRNGDDEADHYENFNNGVMVAENFHCFTLNLETDSRGNFYFAHGAPWPPEVQTPHQGILFQLSPDGRRLRPFADGLRGPNGMAIGPDDRIAFTDNEGHWLPTCSLQLAREGGFHGMLPTAHLHQERPADFEKPICWIPHAVDNSPGSPVWIQSARWGPLQGHMLLTSYGKANLSLVLTETVGGVWQGGTIRLPLRFPSGLIRARMSPHDDHLYACGLSVWQTEGVEPGGFYRVRYTGLPLNLPIALRVQSNGVELTFSDPLASEQSSDPQNYSIEQWNYRWIGRYGSPPYSVKNPEVEGHDPVPVEAVRLAADRRTIFLQTPPLQPVMQMKIAWNIQAADGTPLRNVLYQTINAVP